MENKKLNMDNVFRLIVDKDNFSIHYNKDKTYNTYILKIEDKRTKNFYYLWSYDKPIYLNSINTDKFENVNYYEIKYNKSHFETLVVKTIPSYIKDVLYCYKDKINNVW